MEVESKLARRYRQANLLSDSKYGYVLSAVRLLSVDVIEVDFSEASLTDRQPLPFRGKSNFPYIDRKQTQKRRLFIIIIGGGMRNV